MSSPRDNAPPIRLVPDRAGELRRSPQSISGPPPLQREPPASLPGGFLRLSRMGKLNAILDLPAPERSLRRMPSAEVHQLIHHVGLEDAGVLVPYLSREQFQSLLDLDLWRGDDFVPERLERWLWACQEYGGPEAVQRRVKEMEPDQLVHALQQLVRVHEIVDVDEPPMLPDGAVSFRSPDNQHVIEVLGPDAEARFPLAWTLMQTLYTIDVEDAVSLLVRVRTEPPVEVAFESERLRTARLGDLGFPPPDEAALMYAWLDPKRARAVVAEALTGAPSRVSRIEGPPLGMALAPLGGAAGYLADVLGGIDDPGLQEQFTLQFSYLASRAAVFANLDLSDVDSLEASTREVFGLLDVGLDYLCRGKLESGREVLGRVDLLTIHRVGWSVIERIRRSARRALEPIGGRAAAALFEAPHDDLLAGLDLPQPRLAEALADGGAAGHRPFASLADARLARDAVKDVAAVARFFADQLGLEVRDADALGDRHALLSTLWLTALAAGEATFEPVERARAERWAFDQLGAERSPAATARRIRSASLARVGEPDGALEGAVDRLVVTPAAARLHDALAGVTEGPIDPKVLADLFLLAD